MCAKNTEGKIQFSLLNSAFIEEMARVRTEGTAKYGGDPDNWRSVPPQAFVDAFWRHALAMGRGELRAPEGTSHAAHAAVNMMFLFELLPQERVGV